MHPVAIRSIAVLFSLFTNPLSLHSRSSPPPRLAWTMTFSFLSPVCFCWLLVSSHRPASFFRKSTRLSRVRTPTDRFSPVPSFRFFASLFTGRSTLQIHMLQVLIASRRCRLVANFPLFYCTCKRPLSPIRKSSLVVFFFGGFPRET